MSGAHERNRSEGRASVGYVQRVMRVALAICAFAVAVAVFQRDYPQTCLRLGGFLFVLFSYLNPWLLQPKLRWDRPPWTPTDFRQLRHLAVLLAAIVTTAYSFTLRK